MMRAVAFKRAGEYDGTVFDHVVLAHDERHLRRKLVRLAGGEEIMVDLAEPVALNDGDALVLEDGRLAGISAAVQAVFAITGRDEAHLMELCWHIGNRHLPCQIEMHDGVPGRILILNDHVIKAMLEGLGAQVREITAPFVPVRGAYHQDAVHSHDHGHHHGHHHE